MATPEDDVLEAVLVHCWETALRRRPIDVHDDFYALGGHSLVAMKIAHRLRSIFGHEVPYLAVLESRTIAALAGNLRSLGAPAADLDRAGRAYLDTHDTSGLGDR